MNTALVLSGGSIKGCFQAGAIAEILESGFRPDAVYGTSVGSLNGVFLADRAGRAARNGQEPDWPAIGRELESFWSEHITSFDTIGRKRGFMKLVWSVLFNRFDGFVDTRPLRRLVRREFRMGNIRMSPVILSACSVNIANGMPVYGTANDERILDYVIASTAIPLSMPISMIEDEPYVDGGIREVAPLRAAIDGGAERIICIVCQSKNIAATHFDRERILELVDRLMEIVTNELVNNDLKQFEFINQNAPEDGSPAVAGPFEAKRRIDLTVIRPDTPLTLSLETFRSQHIADTLRLGRAAARKSLEKRNAGSGLSV